MENKKSILIIGILLALSATVFSGGTATTIPKTDVAAMEDKNIRELITFENPSIREDTTIKTYTFQSATLLDKGKDFELAPKNIAFQIDKRTIKKCVDATTTSFNQTEQQAQTFCEKAFVTDFLKEEMARIKRNELRGARIKTAKENILQPSNPTIEYPTEPTPLADTVYPPLTVIEQPIEPIEEPLPEETP
jgi:hypothetical protein